MVNTISMCHIWGPKNDPKMTPLWGAPSVVDDSALPSSFLAVKRGPTPSGTPETPKPLKTIQNPQTRTTFKTRRRDPHGPLKNTPFGPPIRPKHRRRDPNEPSTSPLKRPNHRRRDPLEPSKPPFWDPLDPLSTEERTPKSRQIHPLNVLNTKEETLWSPQNHPFGTPQTP